MAGNRRKESDIFSSKSDLTVSTHLRVGTVVSVFDDTDYDIKITTTGADLVTGNGLGAFARTPQPGNVVTSVNGNTGDVTITKDDLQLGAVDNTSDANKPISTAQQAALDQKINTSLMGVANGVATLQGDGKIPASELPSYVDEVLEYPTVGDFPATGETGRIYITLDTNKQYRWSGTVYVELSTGGVVWGGITGTLANQADLQSALNSKLEVVPVATSTTFGGFKYTVTDGGKTLNLFTS